MNKTIILLIIFINLTLNAQWKILQEASDYGYINDIDFYNEKIGWIECDYKVFLTRDGGESWETVFLHDKPKGAWRRRPPHITDAGFVNDTCGLVIYDDSLYITKDGGNSWRLYLSGSSKIQVCNNIMVIAKEGYIRKSIDGGNNWDVKYLYFSGSELRDLYFLNKDYGFLVYSTIVEPQKLLLYKTVDGGINWNIASKFENESECYDFFFINDMKGYIIVSDEEKKLYTTNDYGNTWQRLADSVSSFTSPSSEEIYISVNKESHGKIYISKDNGITWNEKYDKNIFINNIHVTKNHKVYLIEGNESFGSLGEILMMNNEGFNNSEWRTFKINTEPFNSIEILDDQKWIIKASNEGFHWGYSSFFITHDAGINYNIISNTDIYSFGNKDTGYYFADGLYKTEDGGTTWSKISFVIEDFYPQFLYFISPDIGCIYGWGGLYKTTNGALTWKKETYDNFDFGSIYLLDEENGWAFGYCYVSETQIILKYDSFGSWTKLYEFEESIALEEMEFYDKNIGFIRGSRDYGNYHKDLILGTLDGGNTWNNIYDMGYALIDFRISGNGTLWVLGSIDDDKGAILNSSDFGESWEREIFAYPLRAISVKDSLIIAVGYGGIIIKTKDNGLTWLNDRDQVVASQYKLFQNYPNPFNSSTIVRYRIPGEVKSEKSKVKNVSLVVYDILGREIATLVNKEQPQGNYEVKFNGNDLTSGIYFYRIQASDPETSQGQVFSETKKMILLR